MEPPDPPRDKEHLSRLGRYLDGAGTFSRHPESRVGNVKLGRAVCRGAFASLRDDAMGLRVAGGPGE